MNSNLVKIDLTPEKYLAYEGEWPPFFYDEKSAYWLMIPEYKTAVCPYCEEEHYEKIDTYSLKAWPKSFWYYKGLTAFGHKAPKSTCIHFEYCISFLNFNQSIPEISDTELPGTTVFPSEIPHVFPSQMDAGCAFIHSVPICKIQDNQFLPKYTLFILTGFRNSKNTENQLDTTSRNFDETGAAGAACRKIPKDIETRDEFWNLRYWAEKEKLFWAEFDHSSTNLQTGKIDSFPYGDLFGRRDPYWISLSKTDSGAEFQELSYAQKLMYMA